MNIFCWELGGGKKELHFPETSYTSLLQARSLNFGVGGDGGYFGGVTEDVVGAGFA